MNLLDLIREDADLLVINKPAGLVCHPTKGDEYSSLISRARLYLSRSSRREEALNSVPLAPLGRRAGACPEQVDGVRGFPPLTSHSSTIVSPQLINRLDRETSGIVIIAKTPTAARSLRRLWESRQVTKRYWAIVRGHVAPDTGLIDAPLGRDVSSRVAIKDCVRPDGASAQTEFTVTRRFTRAEGDFTLLDVTPRTGRKHQIRIHLAHLGHPLVGDKLYGGDDDLYLALVENRLTDAQRARLILPHHALHARELSFTWQQRDYVFQAAPEPWFTDFLT